MKIKWGRSEILDPGPQLDFPGPGAAVLMVQLQVACGDRIGVEQPIGAALVGARVARLPDAAVDDDVTDMDVVRLQFAREALREAAQREFTHRERGGAGIALDAGAGSAARPGGRRETRQRRSPGWRSRPPPDRVR